MDSVKKLEKVLAKLIKEIKNTKVQGGKPLRETFEKFEYDDRLTWLLNRDMRTALFERKPECFIPLALYGTRMPVFCVCNREGFADKKMVEFSLLLAKKLAGNKEADPSEVKVAIEKLETIYNKLTRKK
jgi:hypothetical protein